MTHLIRFCPSCQTERELHEVVCQGTIDGNDCGWDLAGEALHPPGWRPPVIVVPIPTPPPQATVEELRCENGHPMDPGDLMCLECGASTANGGSVGAPEPPTEGEDVVQTTIDGWALLRQMTSTDTVRDVYEARHSESGQEAYLYLYRPGAEPDPAVYDVVRRLPREHVPEIFTTGRWNDRAYEISEKLTGESLADLGIVLSDMHTIHHVVQELGQALHAFNEAGLRHRDLRPGCLLVRSRFPIDLVISGFGSARLSEFDLDIVSPLEMTRYMAPEAIAGGVAAASDWWSLGMILLEQVTQGACFAGINSNAFLIHVLTHGVPIPEELDPHLSLLLRGLLSRDRHERWQWPQVQRWLNNEPVSAPQSTSTESDRVEGASIELGQRRFHNPFTFALAAAEANDWQEALELLLRGSIVTWADSIGLQSQVTSGLRQIVQQEGVEDDFRLMLALKVLNPDIPLIHQGHIVTPGWLLEHPLEAYRLISGPVPELLERLDTETWLSRLKDRADAVRQRAAHQDIALNEGQLRIFLLSTSRARLLAQWQERQRLLPDTEHPGILALADRRVISEEDLIVLLSAEIGQFRSIDAILDDATALAKQNDILIFDREAARALLQQPRLEIYRTVDERISGFAYSGVLAVDEWAEHFRLERRMSLARAAALLAIPREQWMEPQKQQYVAQIIEFFEKKVAVAVMRGPLVRMSIGKTTARIDITELDGSRHPAPALLDHLLQRNARQVSLDPQTFQLNPMLAQRLTSLDRQSSMYRRDTGIDGLYLGYPFLLTQDTRANSRTRITPVLLWPVKLMMEIGVRGQVALAFDGDREEVRLNPALETLVGTENCKKWRSVADELLGRSSLRAADVMDAFGMLASPRSRILQGLPSTTTEVIPGQDELACAAVLFHVTFMGQAVGEDLRQLKKKNPAGTGLSSLLRLEQQESSEKPALPSELDRYFVVKSDPSQESAVLQARQAPGLLIEGPPGTGKSQTIVNMVADAIGRGRSLLIVCQKHAALDVVRKRLVAEGLEQRIVMVNDVNKDREPVIRSIREQLDTIMRGAADTRPLMRQRERLAARIESLEGDLDRLHIGLHKVEEHSGLSYRRLLGELMELEEGKAPLNFPELRQMLATLDVSTLARLEENCAPLIRLWLPARYEGSPFSQLKPFAADEAAVRAFEAGLKAFMEAELARQTVLKDHPASFEVDDPNPYRSWLDHHSGTLLNLSNDQRQRLAKWLPLFRTTEPGTGFRGEELLTELVDIEKQLESLNPADYAPLLGAALNDLADKVLSLIQVQAKQVLGVRSWWAWLNPALLIRRSRLRSFLRQNGETEGYSRIGALLAAATIEAAWRPLRHRLLSVRRELGIADIPKDCGPDLLSMTSSTIHELREIQVMADVIAQAPRAKQLDSVVLTGERSTFEALVQDIDSALVRHGARQNSNERLRLLAPWLSSDLYQLLDKAISTNQTNVLILNRFTEGLPHLAAYQRFRARTSHLTPLDLELLAQLRHREQELGQISPEDLEESIRRMLNREARLGWKHCLEQASPELLFSQDEARTKIASLADADAQMRKLNRDLLGADIEISKLGSQKQWEDVTRLTGKRSRRLREFIEMGSKLGLMNLRPVWLMNPDVASRVLPLEAGLFDIVIYDEASQMPVEFSLPTLFRGKVSIVSGDEKQMPPSAFFTSRINSDEGEQFDGDAPDEDAGEEEREAFEEAWNRREIKDCPDLLLLARSSLPVSTLQIHYRSAYRELIGFSNASFYGNRLSVPVRHPESSIKCIKPLELWQVNGLYQGQTNEIEAERVVSYLADLWKLPAVDRPSVGVVTFNRKQADLIEERLELRAEQDEIFRLAYTQELERTEDGEDMSVFVKNVENVQGDERDVIVFSSTFGRNAQGTFRRTFGVLGQKGGERRLNVAVTRARQKVVMITSMPIGDISDMLNTQRSPATPRDYLQGYLEYARALSNGEFDSYRHLLNRLQTDRSSRRLQHKSEGDGFTESVARFIKSLGWHAASANEDDAFGLDFAIEDPATGLFAIGIECDAPRHELLSRARAREIWRPSVLKRAIPHIHRVSSTGWYHEGEKERALLKAAVEQAIGTMTKGESPFSDRTMEPAQ